MQEETGNTGRFELSSEYTQSIASTDLRHQVPVQWEPANPAEPWVMPSMDSLIPEQIPNDVQIAGTV